MQKTKIYKAAGIIMGVAIIALSIFLLFAILQIKEWKPVRTGLQGYFQANVQMGEMSPGYRANFDYRQGKSYYISYIKDEEIISEGTYEKVNDVLYTLTDKSGKKLPITLVHDTFYYYDEKLDYMVEFKLIDIVPTYFRGEEG